MSISLKELKKNRLTPGEKWLTDFIEGVEPITHLTGNVGWFKDGRWLFKQDFINGELYVATFTWWILEEKFGLNDNETRELLTNILYNYTDNGKLKVN